MKSKKRVAIFGCKQTTKFILDFLYYDFQIDFLITIDPVNAEKNEVADYFDFVSNLDHKNILIHQAKSYSLKDESDISKINALSIDVAFVIGWQRLIPGEILDKMSIGCFGMHGSSMNLPLGRGRSPMNWSLIEGRKVFYTNLFKYDSGVDSGDILDTFKFSINDRDTAETMHFKNTLAMKCLIAKNYSKIIENDFVLKKQPNITPTYYPKRSPDDSLIDWNDDIFRIERFIRATAPPFNGAYTFVQEQKLTILDAQIFDVNDFHMEFEPSGKVVEVFSRDKFLVKGYGGLLLVKQYTCSISPVKGDILNNGVQSIKGFPTNRYGHYDI